MLDALFLIDPVVLSTLPALDLAVFEPESDLLLGVLDAVGAVADVAADIDGIVTTDGTWLGGERVGGTEEDCSYQYNEDGSVWVGLGKHTTASLDGITTFPDHGADGSAAHI